MIIIIINNIALVFIILNSALPLSFLLSISFFSHHQLYLSGYQQQRLHSFSDALSGHWERRAWPGCTGGQTVNRMVRGGNKVRLWVRQRTNQLFSFSSPSPCKPPKRNKLRREYPRGKGSVQRSGVGRVDQSREYPMWREPEGKLAMAETARLRESATKKDRWS